jgi:conjugal transfer mating pair stabilization protein TraN
MRVLGGLLLIFAAASPALADPVRDDAKIFVKPIADAAAGTADDENAAATNLPGYNGGNAPERAYLDNAPALEAARVSAVRSNEASVLVIDGSSTRPQVPGTLVDETVARGETINQDPATFARGVDANGTPGQCVELPPTTNSPGNFEARCNAGFQVVSEIKMCAPALVPSTTSASIYHYWVAADAGIGGSGVPRLSSFQSRISSGVCVAQPSYLHFCDTQVVYGGGGGDVAAYLRFCKRHISAQVQEYKCSAAVSNAEIEAVGGQFVASNTGQYWFKSSTQSVTTVARDDSVCAPLASDSNCSFQEPEVCTDSTPETRDVNGTLIAQPCWAWKREYQCNTVKPGNDCSAIDMNPACQYARTECLDDPQSGACKVEERIYTCPILGSSDAPKQYVCGGDIYCVGGECEAVTREASDEFKDAVVGLESLAQAKREFTDVDFKLFKGTAMSCHKPVFGLVNCCAGKSSGLIATTTGFTALAGGPLAIAALASPLLQLFLCSPSEMELDVRDRMGLCHTLGTWCSGSFLGICHSKRTTSCCFLSKLTRVLQEQGRAQLGKSWGKPKTPDCSGFTVDEFAALDLSKMDFTEVYKEFVDAAKLPNEAAAMTDIQAKIQAYYARGRPQ